MFPYLWTCLAISHVYAADFLADAARPALVLLASVNAQTVQLARRRSLDVNVPTSLPRGLARESLFISHLSHNGDDADPIAVPVTASVLLDLVTALDAPTASRLRLVA